MKISYDKEGNKIVEYESEKEFKESMADSIIESNKPDYIKTIEKLTPLLYSLALMYISIKIVAKKYGLKKEAKKKGAKHEIKVS